MKKILITLFCFTCVAGFAQTQTFTKTFPANENINYIMNSGTLKGLVFHYKKAADTSQTVFYIPNFKLADIQLFGKTLSCTLLKFASLITKAIPEILFILSLWTVNLFTSTINGWQANLINHEKNTLNYDNHFQLHEVRAKNLK